MQHSTHGSEPNFREKEMIDRITAEKIHEAAQILDVVSDFVTLRKSGANYKGLCPFHDDRTPSFIVSPAKNYCKCFACGKGGNPVGFIMEHEQLSYPDALRYLAKKYGIEVREKELTAEEKAAQTERESMFIVNEWAQKWFRKQLTETTDGRAIGLSYFRERGFRDDIMEKFLLGFSPRTRDAMSKAAIKEGYREEFLVSTGLSIKREDGSLSDRFWGRVMFPWFTLGGKVVGFGGRVLDAATKGVAVKYQNSPESAIFSKRRELYGLYQAKQAIVKMDQVYMVEGYTDVISMHQCGIENVVANSGTALTKEQIHLLHRFTNNITLLYDGDEAGIHAAQRGTDMLLSEGMSVKILLLPDGDDPDSFARKHDATTFRRYVEEHQVDFIRFKTKILLAGAKDDPRKLSQLTNEIVLSISFIPDEITRSFYIRETAQSMMMDEQIIQRAVHAQMVKNREEEHKRRSAPQQITPADNTTSQTTEDTTAPVAEQQSESPKPTAEHAKPHGGTATQEHSAELLLAQMIVRYGERTACEAEDDQGNVIPLSVCEFIQLSLSQDSIEFRHPTARIIMEKAMKHIHDDGFVAEKYFLGHNDPWLSQTAFQLCVDKEELSKYHFRGQQPADNTSRLLELATHLLADMKIALVRKEIQRLLAEMKRPNSPEQGRELLVQYKEMKEAEKRLAKECGDRVLV